jgi:hypothetical protein
MHIEAELDGIHTQRLTALQQRWQKPLPEVLAILIDWATSHSPESLAGLPEPISMSGQPCIRSRTKHEDLAAGVPRCSRYA